MAIANKTCVSGKKSRGLKICRRNILPVRQINIWQAPTRVNLVSTRKTGNNYHKRRLFTNIPAMHAVKNSFVYSVYLFIHQVYLYVIT